MHNNTISRFMHIRFTYNMILKTRFIANIRYKTHPNANKYISIFLLTFSHMIGLYIKISKNIFVF